MIDEACNLVACTVHGSNNDFGDASSEAKCATDGTKFQ
jgi:hypothetical protein